MGRATSTLGRGRATSSSLLGSRARGRARAGFIQLGNILQRNGRGFDVFGGIAVSRGVSGS